MMLVVPPESPAAVPVSNEGQFHVRMRIDAARHHILPARIDDLRARGHVEIEADREDRAAVLRIGTEHIGAVGAIGIDHRAGANQDRHVAVSSEGHALATRVLGLLRSFIHAPYTIDAIASPTNHAYV
jgi:hypothetical protein